jgi:hypothetical protein
MGLVEGETWVQVVGLVKLKCKFGPWEIQSLGDIVLLGPMTKPLKGGPIG